MEADKRPSYVWIIVLLANLGVVWAWVLAILAELLKYSHGNPWHYFYENVFNNQIVITICVSILLSVVPILISKSNNKSVRRLGYGIPILLLLPIPYFIYDYYTCTGKFCELEPVVYGWACVISAVIISIFYTLGAGARKWNPKVFQWIICLEILLLAGSAYIFAFTDIYKSF